MLLKLYDGKFYSRNVRKVHCKAPSFKKYFKEVYMTIKIITESFVNIFVKMILGKFMLLTKLSI